MTNKPEYIATSTANIADSRPRWGSDTSLREEKFAFAWE